MNNRKKRQLHEFESQEESEKAEEKTVKRFKHREENDVESAPTGDQSDIVLEEILALTEEYGSEKMVASLISILRSRSAVSTNFEEEPVSHAPSSQKLSIRTSSSAPSNQYYRVFTRPTWRPLEHPLDSNQEFQTPWLSRKSLPVDRLWNSVACSLNSFRTYATTGRDYVGLVISGANGTGKTRAGYEIGPLLQQRLLLSGWSYARYFTHPPLPSKKDGLSLPVIDAAEEEASEKWLKRSLAMHHGVVKGEELSWPALLQGIRSASRLDTLSSSSSKNLVLFVQIDEFQRNSSFCTHLVRQLSRLLTDTSTFHEAQVLIVPIFTGARLGPIAHVTEFQTHQFLLLGLDSLTDARNFFQQHLLFSYPHEMISTSGVSSSCKSRLTEHEENTIFAQLGYIPCMLRLFCQIICRENPADFDSAWHHVSQSLLQTYNQLPMLEKQHLCLLSFFKIPINSNYLINGQSLRAMMTEGNLFLSGTVSNYIVVLPAIFYNLWQPGLFDQGLLPILKTNSMNTHLPNLAIKNHRTTYGMLRLWKSVQQELQIQHTPNSLDIKNALTIPNESFPPLKFEITDDHKLRAQVSLRLISAGAAEDHYAIDDEFIVDVDDGESAGETSIQNSH